MSEIRGFRGNHRWLSNFWPAKVTLDGIGFLSVEHAYQAAKTLDLDQRRHIAGLATPAQAKHYGRKLRPREDWELVKLKVMEDLLHEKFLEPRLREKLVRTGDAYLEEKNSWRDFFWGVCHGKGENHLGRLLMQIRDDLRASNERQRRTG